MNDAIKKSAASSANASDTKQNEAINIITQAIKDGKNAVYIKRDGWTLAPQLPRDEGQYTLLCGGVSENGHKFTYCYTAWFFPWADNPYHGFDDCIAWRKIDKPEWALDLIPQEVKKDV